MLAEDTRNLCQRQFLWATEKEKSPSEIRNRWSDIKHTQLSYSDAVACDCLDIYHGAEISELYKSPVPYSVGINALALEAN